ncbi:MAG TPA: iron-sulfur cluster assembly accessory protein [Candidatus Eisenbacteria bacterium]|jgi:Fe/S biogenesis protein NfuA
MSEPLVTLSPAARAQILALMKNEGREGLVLRMAIAGRAAGGFQYRLAFAPESERGPSDPRFDAGGFDVVVDAASVESLTGASIDYVDSPHGSGFKIDNPNPLWTDPKAQAVQKVLDDEINPAVASHGGHVALLEVKDDVAYIQLGGGCQGCGMVDVTLKQGIEVRIREAVPSIREIVDTTDHAGGKNPYYQPSKGGRSPYA